MSDKDMTSVSNGKMAQLAYTYFKEELDKEKDSILNKLKQMAKDSKHDLTEYAGGIIAINHFDSLESRLVKVIKSGNKTEEGLAHGTTI